MRKVFSLIIFGLLTTSAAPAMEDDGLSPIMREAIRKAKQQREMFDKELKQLERDPDRDTPCPWDKVKVTLPEGVAAPSQSKDDEDASPKEGPAATKPLVLAVSAPVLTKQALVQGSSGHVAGTVDVTDILLEEGE